MKKLVLDITQEVDFLLYGLVTPLKPVSLAWGLNNTGYFNLFKAPDLSLANYNPNFNSEYTKYEWNDDVNHLIWMLLSNKEFGSVLCSELKQFDYLMLITGGVDFVDDDFITTVVRSVKQIQAINIIEDFKIKEQLSWII